MQTVFSLFITLLLSAEAKIGGRVFYESELIIPEEQFADLKTSDPRIDRKPEKVLPDRSKHGPGGGNQY